MALAMDATNGRVVSVSASGNFDRGYFHQNGDGSYSFDYTPNINYENMNHLMYGVINPNWTPVVHHEQPNVALYGVAPVIPTHGSGNDLNITRAKLEENISILRNASSTIRNAWETTTKRNLTTIQNSWAGPDCDKYIKNVSAMNKKVNNTVEALNLLANTYQDALDMVDKNQRNIMNILE